MTPGEQLALVKKHYALNTAGDDHVVEIVEFSLADGSTVDGAEVIRFRGDQICDIRPFYFDPTPMIAVAAQSKESGDSPA